MSRLFPRSRTVIVLGAERLKIFRVRRSRSAPAASLSYERHADAGSRPPTWDWLEHAAREAVENGHLPPGEPVDLVLMRPLASARGLDLPRCRNSILRRLLAVRCAAYFPPSSVEMLIDASHSRELRLRPDRAVAACASADSVDSITEALAAGGIAIRRIVAGPVAVAHAAGLVEPSLNRAPLTVLAAFGDHHCELISLCFGRPASFVPLPVPEDPTEAATVIDRIASAMTGSDEQSPRTVAVGFVDSARVIAGQSESGFEFATHAESDCLERLAAIGTIRLGIGAPDLSPADTRSKREHVQRMRTAAALVLACAAMSGIAWLHLLDIKRELEGVREARAVLAPAVEEAIRTRRTVQFARTVAAEVVEFERRRTDWTTLFADLAEALPETAFVTRLEANADSILLVGRITREAELPIVLNGIGATRALILLSSAPGDESSRIFEARIASSTDGGAPPISSGGAR